MAPYVGFPKTRTHTPGVSDLNGFVVRREGFILIRYFSCCPWKMEEKAPVFVE
jgi:hypothetical protein